MTIQSMQTPDERHKPHLFSAGYRACDTLLLVLLLGGPLFVYYSVNTNHVRFSWFHLAILCISFIAILGLLRIRFAFFLLALPFFIWAGYSVIRWLFFPPKWWDLLLNPIYDLKWWVSIIIEYKIGAYFWSKHSGVEFLDWVGDVIGRIKG